MTASSPSNLEQIRQQAVEWHVRLTSGNPLAGTSDEFENWRRQSPEHEAAYRDIEKLWQQLPAALLADRQRRRELAARRHAHQRRHRIGLAVAASLVLAVVAGFYPDYFQNPLADYRTHIGEHTSITLADGSVAHLNTDTAIDVAITGNERRVRLLRGEAEFDVAHDASRPFRVAAGPTTTEALGTRFVVRVEGGAGSVTLLQGKVKVSRPSVEGKQDDGVTLQTGQRVGFDRENLDAVLAIEPGTADAWRHERLLMNFVPLKQVIAELNRYRRSPILLDEALAEREVNVAIDLKQIDAWLEALQQTMPVKIIKAGPLVFLRS